MFVQKTRKMVFLTSRSQSKHVFALGVDPTARNAMKAGILTSEPHQQAMYTLCIQD